MVSPKTADNRCPNCGDACAAEALVCTKCQTILAPHTGRRRTPGWVIAFLVLIIVALLWYVIYLAYNTFVLHNY